MSGIKVENVVKGFKGSDYDGEYKDGKCLNEVKLKVKSHWNYDTLVVVELNGKEYCFSAKDLELAIDNATNHK